MQVLQANELVPLKRKMPLKRKYASQECRRGAAAAMCSQKAESSSAQQSQLNVTSLMLVSLEAYLWSVVHSLAAYGCA